MKKLTAIILALIISCSCLTLINASEPEDSLGFAVASDLHVLLPRDELERTNDDPIFWYAARTAALRDESGFILDSFLAQCEADDSVEFVLIPGDITNDGYYFIEQHEYAAQKLRAFEERCGKQVYVINGNHDVRTEPVKYTDFKTIYAQFGYDRALETRENDCSYTADLGEKYRLIALDSCDYGKSTADGMTSDKINWVQAQTEKAKADGRYPVLMMHHNLLNHMPLQTVISKDFIIKNHSITAEKFANWGIKLVLTGHEHCSDATSYTSTKGNVITDFATTSLSMYPLSYRVFSLTDNEIKYTSKKVKGIDTQALSTATSGYTPEMLGAMNDDFEKYAKAYLKAGIEYRLALPFTPEKLKIDEDAFYYDFVMRLVNTLTDSLDNPLYGAGGLAQAGKKYGIELPQSSYANGWDLATDLVAMHYEGNEGYSLDSAEVTILLRAVAIILREEFSAIGDELYLTTASKILENLGIPFVSPALKTLTATVFGGITPLEYCVVALLAPFLYEFAFDSDGVDDNNGTLAGYGTVTPESNAQNVRKNLEQIIKTFFKHIECILKYLVKLVPFVIK